MTCEILFYETSCFKIIIFVILYSIPIYLQNVKKGTFHDEVSLACAYSMV